MFYEMKTRSTKQDELTNKLIDTLINFNDNKTEAEIKKEEIKNTKKWKPENTNAIITTLLGSGGIIAIIEAVKYFFKGGNNDYSKSFKT